MAKTSWEERGPKVALLDRFADSGRSENVDGILASIRAELIRLTNTRRLDDDGAVPSDVAGYGIPDLSTYRHANEGASARLRARLESAIRHFEPRLDRVSVAIQDHPNEPDRLNLQLRARLVNRDLAVDLDLLWRR